MKRMTKKITFTDCNCTGKTKIDRVILDLEYKPNNVGDPCFSVCGFSYNKRKRDCIHGGQCLDELKKYLGHNKLFLEIHGLWKRNHLNDVDACANDAQRNAVDEYRKIHNGHYDYDGVCKHLQDKGIYTVTVDGIPCTYGKQWYYRPISKEDQKRIRAIMKEAA